LLEKYIFGDRVFKNIEFEIFEYGLNKTDPNAKQVNVHFPLNRLWFIKKGSGFIENSHHNIILKKDRLYFIPANSTYTYNFQKELHLYYFQFTIKVLNIYDIFEKEIYAQEYILEKDEIEIFKKKITNKNKIIDALHLKLFLLQNIMYFIKEDQIDFLNSDRYSNYKNELKFIYKNLSIKLSLKDLEEKFFISQIVYRKSWKKDFGITFKQYIDRLLINEIKKKLILAEIKIKEVAFMYGFNDEYYFSRFFKKYTHLSPSDYKKSVLG